MLLSELIKDLPEKKITGDVDNVEIKGVVYDPLRVEPGFLYIAINIYTQLDKVELPDGHPFVMDAINKGAVAVVLQRDMEVPEHITKIVVPDSRLALGIISNRFYGFPSRQFKLIGITGTNGKTTTTHIVESIFIQKYKIGLIGTLYYKLNGEIHKSKDTTPEPPDLQAILREMADLNFDYCVLEASSHGIDFHRLEGLDFDVAVFTNFTQDHLDYHKTMENYLATKLRFFGWLSEDKHAIVNMDDPHGIDFKQNTKAQVITYGINTPSDVMAKNIRYGINGTKYELVTPQGSIDVNTKLVGRFNVYNALAAVGVAVSQDLDLQTIKSGLEKEIRVAGRFEQVDKGQDFSVVVDYAHTPDGMENVLSLAKSLNPNRLITIFGAGGDRDHDKRPLMAEVAAKYSDEIILTADNPRNEDPEQIIDQIAMGLNGKKFHRIIDRAEAIQYGINMAKKGDIVMILGKGHETTQTLKEKTIEFNDRVEAEKALENQK